MISPQEAALAGSFDSDEIVTALKAAAEPTRLRILLLLAAGELNVKDLTQSSGRASRASAGT